MKSKFVIIRPEIVYLLIDAELVRQNDESK